MLPYTIITSWTKPFAFFTPYRVEVKWNAPYVRLHLSQDLYAMYGKKLCVA